MILKGIVTLFHFLAYQSKNTTLYIELILEYIEIIIWFDLKKTYFAHFQAIIFFIVIEYYSEREIENTFKLPTFFCSVSLN